MNWHAIPYSVPFLGAVALLASWASPGHSATIALTETSYSIDGTIRPGDYQRFYNLVVQSDKASVLLNSNGGNLNEAMKIGNLVSKLRLMTAVPRGNICASACFFIWINGSPRYASAIRPITSKDPPQNIGLHRPYLANPTGEQRSFERQKSGQKFAASYLEERAVPRRLIDVMLSRPSNDIYWVRQSDLNELGEYPSDVEELLIARCEYDRRLFETEFDLRRLGQVSEADVLKSRGEAADACSNKVLEEISSNLRMQVLKSN